ncbi:hypothetical protein ACIBF5_29735 [Micromonospora sp. NPDC050417]|uniref:hypothetical protein n=1 Tax=Micromonospora sp. NPDC050417 TaxID=3364280 RepID=UPI00379E4011
MTTDVFAVAAPLRQDQAAAPTPSTSSGWTPQADACTPVHLPSHMPTRPVDTGVDWAALLRSVA